LDNISSVSTTPRDSSQLFRSHSLDQPLSEIGVPLGMTRGWTKLYVFALVVTMTLGALTATLGAYARKSRVSGFLVPDKGLMKIYTPHAGHIADLKVVEGQHVSKGDALCIVDVGAITMAGRTGDLEAQNLTERRQLISAELDRLTNVQRSDREKLEASIASIQTQITAMAAELASRKEFNRLSRNAFERNKALASQSIYSVAQSEKAEQDLVASATAIAVLERARATSQGDLAQAIAEEGGLADKQANETSQLKRTLDELDQQILQIQEQRFVVLQANESGTITRVTVRNGAAADPATPLLTIVPDDAKLEAYLYVPSNAAGFVHPGAQVLLRYEAYPYEKFGVQDAEVTSVSRTSVDVKEMPFSEKSDEPLYLVTATLAKPTITAFGAEEPLQAGSKFQADLVLESRPIWEWALEPLLAAKQSM
jgi:membrane fusion protein